VVDFYEVEPNGEGSLGSWGFLLEGTTGPCPSLSLLWWGFEIGCFALTHDVLPPPEAHTMGPPNRGCEPQNCEPK
jgi:hypothetical protein